MASPFLSIITASYNRAHLLPRCIESVLNQSCDDFELIIVDDGSTDNTAATVSQFNDPRIVYHPLPNNVGQPRAKNVGTKRARGAFVSYLDSDDEYLPGFVEEIRHLTEEASADIGFFYTNRIIVVDNQDGSERFVEKSNWIPPADEDTYLYFLHHRYGSTGFGLTVRRSCFEVVGYYDEELPSAIDKDLSFRLARRYNCAVSAEPLYKVHLHEGPRVTSGDCKKARSYERIYAKHKQTLHGNNRIAAQAYYKLALLHNRCRNKARRRLWMRKAITKQPTSLKLWVAAALFELFGTRMEQIKAMVTSYFTPARSDQSTTA